MCKCVSVYCTIPLTLRYDARVKAMEIDERPTEQYSDIGGLDKQIQEVGTIHFNCSQPHPLPRPPFHHS